MGDEAAVLVMARLGLRKMEAARLQARDVNLAQDVLYIRDAKGGKPAELPITFEDLRQALSLWLSEPVRRDDDHLIAPLRGPDRQLDPSLNPPLVGTLLRASRSGGLHPARAAPLGAASHLPRDRRPLRGQAARSPCLRAHDRGIPASDCG